MDKRQSVGGYEDDVGVQVTDSPTVLEKSGIQRLLPRLSDDGPSPSPQDLPTSPSPTGSSDTVVAPPRDSPHSKLEPDAHYVTGYKLAGLVTGMTVAVFLIYLDNSIISTATPVITADLHETADIGWYAGAYTLVS
jgi:hypothetical protein